MQRVRPWIGPCLDLHVELLRPPVEDDHGLGITVRTPRVRISGLDGSNDTKGKLGPMKVFHGNKAYNSHVVVH